MRHTTNIEIRKEITKLKRFFAMLLCVVMTLSLCLCAVGCSSSKNEYPIKPIDIIVPWPAGGGSDLATRLYATYLEKELGTTINVSCVPGGSGAVGAVQVAGAKADGYTLVMTAFDFVSADVLGIAGYSIDDFVALGAFTVQPTVYVVLSENWNSTEDYVAYCKENPHAARVGHNGDGAVWHQSAALANQEMGIETDYVVYNGASEELAALLGGHIEAACLGYDSVVDYLRSGELYCIGAMTEERIEALPDCKTFKEQGYDVVYSSFRGLAAPAGIPDDVKETLSKAINAVGNNEEWKEAARKASFDPWYLDADDFDSFMHDSKDTIKETLTMLRII